MLDDVVAGLYAVPRVAALIGYLGFYSLSPYRSVSYLKTWVALKVANNVTD